jgi:Mn-dependent DtxR family transcriptional regulator
MLLKLGVSEKNANEDACKMEHILSQESLDAIDAFVHDEKND